MNKNEKIQSLIKLLEKTTGKKVMAEVIEGLPMEQNKPLNEIIGEPPVTAPELSKRRLGAQQALKTKGFDDWTKEQYALCYWLVVYHKRTLPEPYNNMPIDQIAADAGVKKSTLNMNGENIRFIISGRSALESVSPKSKEYVDEFADMPKDELSKLVMVALGGENKPFSTENGKSYKYAQLSSKKKKPTPVTSASEQQSIFLQRINAQRAKQGMKPYFLRDGKPVTESKMLPWIKNKIENTPIDQESQAMVESIIRQSNNCMECETITAMKAATKYPDPIKNIARYKAAKKLRKESIAEVFLSDVNDFFNTLILNETINELSSITKSKIELKGENKVINEQRLNEFFSNNAYEKFLSTLEKAKEATMRLNKFATMYSDEWKGNEKQVIEGKLKEIFKNFTQGSGFKKKNMFDRLSGVRRYAESESKNKDVKLNEWYVRNEYKKLVGLLDSCIEQAEKVHEFLKSDKQQLKADAKEILGNIKAIWKTFNKTRGIESVTFASDPVNKLSHKPYEKEQAKKAAEKAANPQPAAAPKKSFMQKAKDLGGKVVGGLKKAGTSLANGIADQFTDDDTSDEKELATESIVKENLDQTTQQPGVMEAEKPSAGLSAKQKSNTVKKAGKNVGKGNFDKVANKAGKEYGSKEAGEKVAAAAMWKNKAR